MKKGKFNCGTRRIITQMLSHQFKMMLLLRNNILRPLIHSFNLHNHETFDCCVFNTMIHSRRSLQPGLIICAQSEVSLAVFDPYNGVGEHPLIPVPCDFSHVI